MKYYIGIDIGGMSIKAGLVDSLGNILVKATAVTPLNSNDDIVKVIFDLVDRVLLDSKNSIDKIESIGIGSPGIVNTSTGEIVYASNLGISHLEIAKKVKEKYGVDCYAENDANCAVLGEYYFGEGNVDNVLMITLGTGVGTGFIINGKLLTSACGGGTEGGHIMVNIDGLPCGCGENGCYERYASASALIQQTEKAIQEDKDGIMAKIAKEEGEVNGKVVFLAVKQNDAKAKEVLNQYIKYVASGLISIVNLFRPQVVLIGGGLSKEKELLIEPLEKYVNEHAFGAKYLDKIEIKQAKLKNDAGILGASMLGENYKK